MEEIHRHEVCVRFETLSIVADGEEIISDPHEYTALGSLRIEYGYILMPATFMESMAESVERVTNVCRYTPTAVLGGTFLSGTQKERGIIVCDIGAEFTNITAYRDGAIIGARAVPFGGNTITDEIALLRKIAPGRGGGNKTVALGEEPMLKKTDQADYREKNSRAYTERVSPLLQRTRQNGTVPGGRHAHGRWRAVSQYPENHGKNPGTLHIPPQLPLSCAEPAAGRSDGMAVRLRPASATSPRTRKAE